MNYYSTDRGTTRFSLRFLGLLEQQTQDLSELLTTSELDDASQERLRATAIAYTRYRAELVQRIGALGFHHRPEGTLRAFQGDSPLPTPGRPLRSARQTPTTLADVVLQEAQRLTRSRQPQPPANASTTRALFARPDLLRRVFAPYHEAPRRRALQQSRLQLSALSGRVVRQAGHGRVLVGFLGDLPAAGPGSGHVSPCLIFRPAIARDGSPGLALWRHTVPVTVSRRLVAHGSHASLARGGRAGVSPPEPRQPASSANLLLDAAERALQGLAVRRTLAADIARRWADLTSPSAAPGSPAANLGTVLLSAFPDPPIVDVGSGSGSIFISLKGRLDITLRFDSDSSTYRPSEVDVRVHAAQPGEEDHPSLVAAAQDIRQLFADPGTSPAVALVVAALILRRAPVPEPCDAPPALPVPESDFSKSLTNAVAAALLAKPPSGGRHAAELGPPPRQAAATSAKMTARPVAAAAASARSLATPPEAALAGHLPVARPELGGAVDLHTRAELIQAGPPADRRFALGGIGHLRLPEEEEEAAAGRRRPVRVCTVADESRYMLIFGMPDLRVFGSPLDACQDLAEYLGRLLAPGARPGEEPPPGGLPSPAPVCRLALATELCTAHLPYGYTQSDEFQSMAPVFLATFRTVRQARLAKSRANRRHASSLPGVRVLRLAYAPHLETPDERSAKFRQRQRDLRTRARTEDVGPAPYAGTSAGSLPVWSLPSPGPGHRRRRI
ncbi:hypothetical protein H696_04956 [Fonticula alba]|uniref:Uncharacterized protein n=1 Tax=Fonticula alba TaxID=691883 RepID=A0A058Z326_FONAL|nr:hypothetical protein H696_04956 [Fonticula alba]KCV68665.1 hypothetical protein H696_04956 [Fonticula alba]|eukprot:XP_009497097.1 hypothetical protein H696_04956 [Fonticula alba]